MPRYSVGYRGRKKRRERKGMTPPRTDFWVRHFRARNDSEARKIARELAEGKPGGRVVELVRYIVWHRPD